MPLFGSRKAHPRRPTDILERPEYGWIWKPLLGLVAVYLAVTLALGAWWSLSPDGFDVQLASAEQRGRLTAAGAQVAQTPEDAPGAAEKGEDEERAGSADNVADEAGAEATATEAGEASTVPLDTSPAGRGAVIIASQMTLLDTLLDKPGGYLRNDVLPPGLWLDNMPAWELGVLRQARGLAHALTGQAAPEQGALTEAQGRLDGDSKDWLYPATERRLAKARQAYATVLGELNARQLALPAEGDVPAAWLSRVARRLDDLTSRLSASVADPEALRELEVEVDQLPGRTPWYRVDDIFFEARGQAWAMEHLLAAMVADYGDVVGAADAEALVERLQFEFEQAQRRLWSPMVLNGTGFGIFANHSLMMAAYTQRAARLAETLSGRLAGVSAAPVDTARAPAVAQPADQEASPDELVEPGGSEGGAAPEAAASDGGAEAASPGASGAEQAAGDADTAAEAEQSGGESLPAEPASSSSAEPPAGGSEATDAGVTRSEG